MKLLRVISIGCICLFPASAFSHTFTLPPQTPRLVLTIPDSLEPVDTLAGAKGGVSEVRTFNVDTKPLKSVDLNGAVDESLQILGQHGTIIEPTSLTKNADKINGLDTVDLSFTIIDGWEKAAITLIAAKPGSFFALIAYGSKKGFADTAEVMKSIRDSIRAK